MRLNFLFSFSLHILLFGIFFVSRPGARKFEGYPTVVPVELVKIKPVSYKAPEVEKVPPRLKEVKPKPKKLEGVTLEKPKPVKEEPPDQPVKSKPEEKAKKGKSAVSGKSVRLDVDEFPFSYYLALLQSRIQSNWEPPYQSVGTSVSKKTVIFFELQRSGQITNILVESASGDYLFDRAAVRAVTLANPLAPLPVDFPERHLGVHFEFEQGM